MAVPQRRNAVTASVPAPLGGWNARDSLAEMSPLDAVEMVNFFPTPSDILMRKGFSKHVQSVTGENQTLMNYAASTQKLFSIANGTIYDVTKIGRAHV